MRKLSRVLTANHPPSLLELRRGRPITSRRLLLQSVLLPFLMLVCPCLLAFGPIRVYDDFESGNLGVFRVEEDTRLIFVPHRETDQDGINSAVTWFYGRLENVLHREIRVDITGLDYTVYNGKKGDILPFERNTVPVYSYDGKHWERFTDCRFDEATRRFRIRQVFSRDVAWIAYIPPFTFSELEQYLFRLDRHPLAHVEEIGRSIEERALYLITVADPEVESDSVPVIWIVARQHSFETGGTWATVGLLRYLTSGLPEASGLLKRFAFKICPMLNPDGVANGGTRFNLRGVDLNRHWSSEDPLSDNRELAPEIAHVKEALSRWRTSHRLDLFINIHNNDMVWNEEGDYIRFAPTDREEDAHRLETCLRRETIFTGPFLPTPTDESTEAVVASETGALSLLMEMKTGYLEDLGRWTGVDLFEEHGPNLARAISCFFDEAQ